jgi:hypothetical protein
MPTIFSRERYTDSSISFLISDIVEYDMKEAGFSIIKEKKLLPQETIDKLSKIKEKQKRTVEIGKLERGNKALKKGKSDGFKHYRELFGEANGLNDEDVLSIKKDALFVKKFCYYTKFDNYIEFVEKNVYRAFMQFGPFEFYLGDNGVDVKGLVDDNVDKHKDGMMVVIKKVMELLSTYDDVKAIKYVVKIIDQYKSFKLPVDYYREFNSTSGYRIIQLDQEQIVHDVGESYKTNLIIDYNFVNVLVPLLNLVMG